MKYKILFLFSIIFSLLSANNLIENTSINPLLQNESWQLINEFDDGIKLYEKYIDEFGIKAYRVESLVDISGEKLLQSFESVDQYETIIPSAKNITFDTIEDNGKKIVAYQHLKIPLISDRHYFYELYKSDSNQKISWWELTDVSENIENGIINKYNLSNPLKLKKGAGVYKVEENWQGTKVHYSLYLDPEGNIPEFLANIANRHGLVNMFRDIINHSANNQ